MITTLATVKILARIPDIFGTGEPTTATAGEIGDIYMDNDTGLTYELTSIVTAVYTWVPFVKYDMIIELAIDRVERDYLQLRGIDFDLDSNGDIVYPDGSIFTSAEMVCYILGLGTYEGRGAKSEALQGRSAQYDDKILGYPHSIIGGIRRYQGLA
jgi:hypothetical protein